MKISVILPTFHESGNIGNLIDGLRNAIGSDHLLEITVVDDSSADGTVEIALEHLDLSVDRVIIRKSNASLGLSILEGLRAAKFDYVLVMDTDFTHSPVDAAKLVSFAERFDVVIGSRFVPGGSMASNTHHQASKVFNAVLRIILPSSIRDNLGGFWIAKTEKIQDYLDERVFQGYGDYFMRLGSLLQRDELSIIEIPARFEKRASGSSKSKFLMMAIKYSLAALRWRLLGQGKPRT